MIDNLLKQGINKDLLKQVEEFTRKYKLDKSYAYRIPQEDFTYIGKDVWEKAIIALLQGEHILLVGPKSTGKNLLANNLASLFKRPAWTVSFHLNSDQSQLLGMDSFDQGRVFFRQGPITKTALQGGFGILDEINMAKNEALSVLHSALDDRRLIDIPGYDLIKLNDATRFIATMNYGYLGTRELNEALVSRFMVIEMPVMGQADLKKLIMTSAEDLKEEYADSFVSFFKDIELKVNNSELSSRALDLRGLLKSIDSMRMGLDIRSALEMGISNKTFDPYEKGLIEDLMKLNFDLDTRPGDLFHERS